MKWETAKYYLHSVDIANIKHIARKQGFKLSGRTIDSIFRMVSESGMMSDTEMAHMERQFEASVGF